MFRKFDPEVDVSNRSKVKSSVQRSVTRKVLEQFPSLESHLEDILPKKAPMIIAKCPDHVNCVVMNDSVMFFSDRNDTYYPSLRLAHQYPDMMKRVTMDRGAIKFILSGAHLMAPGLTGETATLPDGLQAGDAVLVYAEGKEHALGVGCMAMSSEEIRTENKGMAVEMHHVLGDGLWVAPSLE